MHPAVAFRILVGVVVAGLVAVAVAGAGVGRWSPSHGPEGGDVWRIVIDPVDSSVVYAVTDHGLFKSTNAAARWTSVSKGLTDTRVRALAIDPRRPSALYAGTESGIVFKSTNAAGTWRAAGSGLGIGWINTLAIDPVHTDTVYAGGEKGLARSIDGGRTWRRTGTGLTRRIVGEIAIDPSTTSTLFVGASSPSASAIPTSIFKSVDGGATWREVLTRLRGGVCGIVIDPAHPATIYAGGQTYDREVGILFKSVDAGESWRTIPGDGCVSLAVDFSRTPHVIYAATSSSLGPLRSDDEGLSWKRIGRSLPDTWVMHLALDPRSPETIYVTPGDSGVFKTTNGGQTWRAVNRGLVGRRIRSLAVHPLDGRTVYVGTGGGVYRSFDGGASWEAPRLTSAWVDALAIDPLRPSRVYAAGSRGVYRTLDGGRRWRAVKSSVLEHGVTALILDPKVPSTLYARVGNVWMRETWRMARSVDSGKSWRLLKPGLPGRWVSSIAVDPHDTSILFAATWPTFAGEELVGGGVFRSTDGGRSWRAAGLSGHVVSSLAIDPVAQAVYAGAYGRVFRSTDGGSTWKRTMRNGLQNASFACDVVLDPAVSSSVYAACGPHVYRSTNGGRRWRPLGGTVPGDILRLAIDSSGRTLYAGTDAGLSDYRFAR